MAHLGRLKPPVSPDLFEGDLYETPALARNAIEDYDFGAAALPFVSLARRNRARERAKAALATIPKQFEDFSFDKLTGETGTATVYVSRKIANETQPVAREIRGSLTPSTLEGTYRALGLGGWHVTLAKATVDMRGMNPEEFADDVGTRLKRCASGLLVPIGGVAIVGAQVCGNRDGGHGSSRFIGLTPHKDARLLEDMRAVKLVFDPMADVQRDSSWNDRPHISVAKAEPALYDLCADEQRRLEGNITASIEMCAAQLRPLTLTAGVVDISDFVA